MWYEPVKHFKPFVLIGWILLWNLILGFAIWLNGGLGKVNSPSASCAISIAVLGSSLFCFLVLFSPRVRSFALQPDGDVSVIRTHLWFIGILTGFLGLGAFSGCIGIG